MISFAYKKKASLLLSYVFLINGLTPSIIQKYIASKLPVRQYSKYC